MAKKYEIYMDCWDFKASTPYKDTVLTLFDTYDQAHIALLKCTIEELSDLQTSDADNNENALHFKIDIDTEEYLAVIRYWEHAEDVETDNDYWNITGYNIREVEI